MAQFKLYIQDELESRITSLPDQGVDGPGSADQPIKIAQITFGFYNRQIITWLKERGNYIKQEKWIKVREMNEKISIGIKDQKILDGL